MIREILIWTYLKLFKMTYSIFRFCPIQQKITFIVSFEANNRYLYKELINQNPLIKIVVLHKSDLSVGFQKEISSNTNTTHFKMNLKYWFLAIYNLSTSKLMIVDNYYGFLSAIKFRKNVECVQIWHAAGALKSFGLSDKSIINRSKRANKRFRSVYKNFTKIIVGSEEMANIFMESFAAEPQNILRLGVPRTDFFFNERLLRNTKNKIFKEYPKFKGKKVILYAPTYREGLNDNAFQMDIMKMYEALKDNFILLIKAHPSAEFNIEMLLPDFVYNLSSYKRVNDLLVIADYLITDYSSIPFEYALLSKPMIFYTYDFEDYSKDRGLIPDYKNVIPGPIAYNTEDIINILETNQINMTLIQSFSEKWNQYSDGRSSERIASYILSLLRS